MKSILATVASVPRLNAHTSFTLFLRQVLAIQRDYRQGLAGHDAEL
ncbi:hypothetical protein RHIZ404_210284 [Rhizobium sp. EC-SD404]|nr:hypothetical protein RHIZ404_210284 [Rhizobium sp. EC-SD404]